MLDYLLGQKIYLIIKEDIDSINEIRLRKNKKIIIKNGTKHLEKDYIITKEDIKNIVLRATNHSLYSKQNQISRGFLSFSCGIRIGIAGESSFDDKNILGFSEITSLCIRLPKQIVGVANKLQKLLENFENTIVVSPPYCGKTTLIRDMARILSYNYDTCIIDERGEITGYDGSEITFDLGRYSDYFINVPKKYISENIIRSMSPEILIMDEFSPKDELNILKYTTNAGIKVLTSVHGSNFDYVSNLFANIKEYFSYGILLSNKPTIGSIDCIVRFE